MENSLTFFDAQEYTSNLRCTIQRSGKIGFSGFTQDRLKLNEKMSIQIGIDGTKQGYNHLLMKLLDTVEPSAFKVNKAGNYYYINPKALLDELNINYKSKNILYEMVTVEEGQRIYKLVKKEGKVNSETE